MTKKSAQITATNPETKMSLVYPKSTNYGTEFNPGVNRCNNKKTR